MATSSNSYFLLARPFMAGVVLAALVSVKVADAEQPGAGQNDAAPSASTYTFGFEQRGSAEGNLRRDARAQAKRSPYRFTQTSGTRVLSSAKRAVYSELSEYHLGSTPVEQTSETPIHVPYRMHPQVWELHDKLQELRDSTVEHRTPSKPPQQHQQVFIGKRPNPAGLAHTLFQAADLSEQLVEAASDMFVHTWKTYLAPDVAYAEELELEETTPSKQSPFPLHSFERDALVHF